MGETIGECRPLTVDARSIAYEVEAEVKLEGADSAGLVIYYGTNAYVSVGLTRQGRVTRGYQAAGGRKPWRSQSFPYRNDTLRVKMINDQNDLRCFYQNEKGDWQILQSSVDVSFMSDNAFLRNSSMRPGLYVTGNGAAVFSYFRYRPYMNRTFEQHRERLWRGVGTGD
jgi:beta-xylosidase